VTDLVVVREKRAGHYWERLHWVVIKVIRSPWAVLTTVGGKMPYLIRRVSKDLTIAFSQVTWD